MVQKHQRNTILVILAAIIAAMLVLAFYLDAGAYAPTDYATGPIRITEIGWAGEDPSPADEWYEVYNGSTNPVDTSTWYLMTVQGDGDIVTATMPLTFIQSGDYALFERTDDATISTVVADGIHGGTGTGGSLVGIFPNDDVISFGIYDSATSDHHVITMTEELSWVAGSSNPNASMQLIDDLNVWITSNSGSELDAEGGIVLGTPGSANISPVPNPDTCNVIPGDYDWDLDLTIFEDMGTQGQVQVDAVLWGFDDSGTVFETSGLFTLVYIAEPVYMPVGWHVGTFSYDPETSNDCIDALENLASATETVLRGDSSDVLPDDSLYATWLRGVVEFQKSGLFSANLPIIVKP